MIPQTYSSGPLGTNSYLAVCPVTKKAFIVDAPPGIADLLLKNRVLDGPGVEAIFLTHSHWDHIGDAKKLRELTGARLFVHPEDKENLEKPGSDGLALPFSIEGVSPDGSFVDNDLLTVGTLTVRILATPGHSPGSVSLYLKEESVLFSGDTLFRRGTGRVDFKGSSPEKMRSSLERLGELPSDVRVFPGHGEPTTIGEERGRTLPRIYINKTEGV